MTITPKDGRAMAVGIFDSGLGGLTVLEAVTKRLPDVHFVYYGDNAHAPYGVRDADDVYKLTKTAVEYLWAHGCDLVILACNTASAAALRRMQEAGVPPGKRVLGVFVPLIEALTERQWGDNSPPREVAVKHVALFATPATVASRAFQRELAFRAIGVDVEAQACGGVVDAIEEGDMILACNTASAAALKRMQETWVPADKRVLGVFVPLIEALTERQWGDNSAPREVAVKHVALFATPATVASRAFQRELAFRAIGVDVEAQPCGGVVDAIEAGDEMLAEALVKSHVEALLRRMPKPEAAILGCTHYPLMEAVFQTALGPDVRVFSQPRLVAEATADYLVRRPEMLGSGTGSRYLTTGKPESVSAHATQFLRRGVRFEGA